MVTGNYLVEVAWNNTYFPNQAGDDITSDVLAIETVHGRDYASQLTGRSIPGKLRATLRNDDNKYSPNNSAGDLYGKLKPGRRIRLAAAITETPLAADFTTGSLILTDNEWISIGDIFADWVVWLRADSLPTAGNQAFIFGKWGASSEYALNIDNTAGTIRFMFSVRDTGNTTDTTVTASTFGSPSTGTWYMVHCYHDPTANTIGISVNNGAHDTAATSGGVRDSVNDLHVGAKAGPTNQFDGRICNLALWKSTVNLTAAQLTWLYNSGSGRDLSAWGIANTDGSALVDDLVVCWPMNEESGTRYGHARAISLTESEGTVGSADFQSATVYKSLWVGFIDDLVPSLPKERFQTCRIRASGVLAQLPQYRNVGIAITAGTTGVVIERIIDSTGLAYFGKGEIDDGQSITGSIFNIADESANQLIRELEETEGLGMVYESGEKVGGINQVIQKERSPFLDPPIHYTDRVHRITAADSMTSQATFSDDVLDTLHYHELEERDRNDEIYNYVTVEVPQYTQDATTDVIWTYPSTSTVLAPGASKTFIAEYPNAAVESDTGAFVETWIDPVVGTDVTYVGASAPTVSGVSKSGNRMFFTVTATALCILTLVQARASSRYLYATPFTADASDPTSQTTYGIRNFKLSAKWLGSAADGQAYCDFIVNRYKDPLTKLAMSFYANKDASHYEQALTRILNDRITVGADTNVNLGINEDFFIETISHRIDMGNTRHIVAYDLSAASADSGYWILGTGALGTSTKLGW